MKALLWFAALLAWQVQAQAQPHAQRIIALSPHLVEQLYSIGAGDRLVAATEHADYPAAAKQLPRVGNYMQLNVEQILLLKPDLVLAWTDGNPPGDISRLRALGLNLVESNPRQLQDIAAELRLLGQLTGHQAQAEQQASLFEQQLSALKQRYQRQSKVRVFYELWADPLSTVANQAWPQQQLALCGAENPFASATGDYPTVGLEQVLVSQPQLIIQPDSEQEKRSLFDWSRWTELPAVKYQQFSKPDSDLLHRTTTRMLQGVERLCQDIDKARSFYQKLAQ
ncbi:cobalamin-binding protein [Rheinheimera sp.]|uniref:cobalamin-binding protein n=1 Tax=Rheinheimera sp. TaxID=1869214 RepID=UPI00307D03E5